MGFYTDLSTVHLDVRWVDGDGADRIGFCNMDLGGAHQMGGVESPTVRLVKVNMRYLQSTFSCSADSNESHLSKMEASDTNMLYHLLY